MKARYQVGQKVYSRSHPLFMCNEVFEIVGIEKQSWFGEIRFVATLDDGTSVRESMLTLVDEQYNTGDM